MDGSFEQRKKSAEAKWAHDEEARFKIYARRNKLLGQWAAGEMGVTGADGDAYARAVVQSDFEKPGEEDVFEKLRGDFDTKGVAMPDHTIRQKMADLLDTAHRQIEAEASK